MKTTKAPFTPEQCREFIQQYSCERPKYERLAKALIAVLKVPAGQLGLPAMVQARAKEVSSFAGKIQRPEKGYTDPLNEITDFCGARVITLTLDGATRICDFVETNFQILWEHSEDKLDSLGSDTFGYLSTHYIVAFRPGEFPEDLVPPDLVGLKAEVQVRTLLQHAWADIAHEFSYKSAISLPTAWKRDLSRLAAMLEEGDQAFDRLQHDLLPYATSYHYHYSDAELADEIARSEVVLEVNPEDKAVAYRLAKLAIALDDWQKAVDVLAVFGKDGTAGMMRDLGVGLCKIHSDDADPSAYSEGQNWIREALEKNPEDVDAWASLGGTWRTLERSTTGDERRRYRQEARDCYRRAFEIDASDPYALTNFIEYELASSPTVDVVPYLRPTILNSIERSKAQAIAGVNLPWAYFSLGEFYLLLGEPVTALRYYALGVDSSTASHFVTSPFRSFDLLDEAKAGLPGLMWARSFLEIAALVRFDAGSPADHKGGFAAPIVIVAGRRTEADDDRRGEPVREALANFEGTIVSAAAADGRATQTDGQDSSPLEAIQYWKDLHASGVKPSHIRMLAVGGGEMAALECCFGLALGVPVGVVSNGGRAAELLDDPYWMAKGAAGRSLLHALPDQAAAIEKFLRASGSDGDKKD